MSQLRVFDDSRLASEDVDQYYAAVLDSNGKVGYPDSIYDRPHGIFTRSEDEGGSVGIRCMGIIKAIAYAAFSRYTLLGIRDTSGRIGEVPADRAFAIALEAATAQGDEIDALILGPPLSNTRVIEQTAITSNTTISSAFEAGTWHIENVIAIETEGNAITGGLNVGTAADGQEIVNAQAVSASSKNDLTLVAPVFVWSSATSLYVHAETAWNDASVNLYVIARRLT
jgi:hypothetical protein